MERLVFARVVSAPRLGRSEEDTQHVGISTRRPQREPVQTQEHEQACEERVKQVEGGGAEDEREEEQTAVDTAHRQRTVDGLVNRSVRRAVWHARISLNSAVDPIKRATLGIAPRRAQ